MCVLPPKLPSYDLVQVGKQESKIEVQRTFLSLQRFIVGMELLNNTIRNFNGKPDFVGCLLVKNGLWPADFSIMYTYYGYKMFKITLHCREISGPESVLNQ